MQEYQVQCLSPAGFHPMHYTEWGARENPRIVICVHGLSRNCRDFDALAQALASDFRVVCPDIVGRGKSGWLGNKAGYVNAQYAADITTLIARLTAAGPREILWVGTSMGGIIGMLLACLPNTPIRRLVLNDVGGIVPKPALARIVAYLGKDPRFNTFKELELCVRTISAPFGPLTDAQWEHLTRHNSTQHADNTWGFNYDPGIAAPFHSVEIADVPLWQYYDPIACPTLLLRGADSDLLEKDIALAMTQRGPRARLVEFPGVGHAPMMMSADQISTVRDFLLAS
jgi:pimeloyl-ACP methyl ester carboxylesterase